MSENVEILALHDTVGLRPIGDREIRGNIEKMAKSSHDVRCAKNG